MPLDLIVPDLLLPADAPAAMTALRLPALEKWLARADVAHSPAGDAASWLALEHGIAGTIPFAALALAGEGAHGPDAARDSSTRAPGAAGPWLRADPVHVRIERDMLVLHDAAVLGLTRAEAEALVGALQAHFAADGLAFRAMAPERWYVSVPDGELPATTPLAQALARDIFGLLPAGTGRINWRSAITEAQMVLAAHEVNAAREAAGRPQANSVWFWGEGALPEAPAPRYSAVYADDVFARGLAGASGAEAHPLPRGIRDVAGASEGGSVAVVLDGLTQALRSGDLDAWHERAQLLERDWFASLGEALERFGSVRIVLPASARTAVATITSGARWRGLLRPRRALSSHA